jgi:hypothetical protein
MAEKACHVSGYALQFGLTQALGRSGDTMRTLSTIFLAALLASCTSQRDYDFLVRHAVTSLDVRANIETVVLTPQLPDQARSAAARYYKTIDQSAVIPVAGYDLAPGLFVLESVTISGNTAHVIGVTGPIHSNANLDCGRTHDISYSKADGGWQVGSTETTVC